MFKNMLKRIQNESAIVFLLLVLIFRKWCHIYW